MYQPKKVITSLEEIRGTLGEVSDNQRDKIIDHVDQHISEWIKRSPFVVVSTYDVEGNVDVSPKGDPPGFVTILDEKTLAVPDRLGNRRVDTFQNLLVNPRIGLMFIVPKRREVVRVSGSAQIVKDEELLKSMAINDRQPEFVILVRVEKAFYHCGKAMIRSRMWQPDEWGSIDGMTTYAQAVMDHARPPQSLEELTERFDRNERERLY